MDKKTEGREAINAIEDVEGNIEVVFSTFLDNNPIVLLVDKDDKSYMQVMSNDVGQFGVEIMNEEEFRTRKCSLMALGCLLITRDQMLEM